MKTYFQFAECSLLYAKVTKKISLPNFFITFVANLKILI